MTFKEWWDKFGDDLLEVWVESYDYCAKEIWQAATIVERERCANICKKCGEQYMNNENS